MKRLTLAVAVAFALLLSACSSPTLDVNQIPQTSSGIDVAAQLQRRYDETIRMCNDSASQPAFLCSGLLLRATDIPNNFHVWDPSPTAIELGGTSFTFFRVDASFQRLPWDRNNGYILYPVLDRPTGTLQTMVLCVFPIDGATWERDKPGCGASETYPVVSKRCQSQGITTAEQWVAHTFAREQDFFRYQCSFDVRDEMNNLAADSFYQAIRSIALKPVGRPEFNDFTEVIIKTWEPGKAESLPIEAFFFTDENALPIARHNQQDFYVESKGKVVPIIKVTMPTAQNKRARFEFRAEDQLVNAR